MSLFDLLGRVDPAEPFQDIRNTRESIAARKAELALQLGRLMVKVPASVKAGSVQTTRQWMETQKRATKIAANKAASVRELTDAIAALEAYQ